MCFDRFLNFFKDKKVEDRAVEVRSARARAEALPVTVTIEERLTEIERVLKGIDEILTETRDNTAITKAGIKLTWYSIVIGIIFAIFLFLLSRIM